MKTTTLYYREGSSDKVYTATLDGARLTLSWGRRGATMQTKVVTGATLADFEKKLAEKRAKGYSDGEAAAPLVAARVSSIPADVPRPMLLTEATEEEVFKLAADAHWCFQVKYDGDRKLIRWQAGNAFGYSRSGRATDLLPKPIVNALQKFAPRDVLVDGEQIGSTFHAFDLLEVDGENIREHSYAARFRALVTLFGKSKVGIVVAETAKRFSEKVALFERVHKSGGEGIVLKDSTAEYRPDRPSRGGPARKYKFVQTASVIVTSHHPVHRSVRMEMVCGTDVGSVSIPPNKEIPPVGAIIEVRYLHYYRDGSMVQSVFLGVRTDIDEKDCTLKQLRFKDEPVAA